MKESSTSDFQRLMATVGYLMFHWSLLEAGLADEIDRLRRDFKGLPDCDRVRNSFSDQLREWRGFFDQKAQTRPGVAQDVARLAKEMAQLRRKRNLVAHNFSSASARPEDDEPFITCVPRRRGSRNDKPRRLTLSELIRTIDAIHRCRMRISAMGMVARAPA